LFRDKQFLKAVASLPCQHCGLEGSTQAAHANWVWSGKGMGIKAHDCFTAALCQSCHQELDQGKNLSRNEREDLWMDAWKKTILKLFERGLLVTK
jgi:hypothetical protein